MEDNKIYNTNEDEKDNAKKVQETDEQGIEKPIDMGSTGEISEIDKILGKYLEPYNNDNDTEEPKFNQDNDEMEETGVSDNDDENEFVEENEDEEFEEPEAVAQPNEDENNYENGKKASKQIAILSLIFIGLIVIFSACGNLFAKFFRKNQNSDSKNSDTKTEAIYNESDNIMSNVDYVTDMLEETTMVADKSNLGDLGIELEFPEEGKNDKNYGDIVSGNINKNEIVEDENGNIWKDEEAHNNSGNVGKEVIDDKNGSLTTDNKGNVVEKETGNEVKHEDGTITTGEGNIPDGYAWDSARGEYVPEEDVGKYIYSDKDFYTSDGELIIAVGDLVTRETYERACRELLTTKPTTEETTPNNSNEENTPNGRYTDSNGNVWNSYEDYLKGIEDYSGIYEVDGVLYYREPEATENPETQETEGLYTDEFGNVWASYNDYLQGIENFDEVYEKDGILYYGKSLVLGR